jgi:hypothetical protein
MVTCVRGDVAVLRSILEATLAVAAMRGTLGPVNWWTAVGLKTATPSRGPDIIGLEDNPPIEALLRAALEGAQPFLARKVMCKTFRGLEVVDDHYTIRVEVEPISKLSAHEFIDLQPETALLDGLLKIGIAPAQAERLIGAI